MPTEIVAQWQACIHGHHVESDNVQSVSFVMQSEPACDWSNSPRRQTDSSVKDSTILYICVNMTAPVLQTLCIFTCRL